jgi:hypothetical protein
MQITREIFTLRMRTGHRLTASYGQGLVVWELVR